MHSPSLAIKCAGTQSPFTSPPPSEVSPTSHSHLRGESPGLTGEVIYLAPAPTVSKQELGSKTGPLGPAARQNLPRRIEDKQKAAGGREFLLLGPRASTWQPFPARDNSVNAEKGATAGPYPNPDVGETVSPKILSS